MNRGLFSWQPIQSMLHNASFYTNQESVPIDVATVYRAVTGMARA